jgi:hypothetical protein
MKVAYVLAANLASTTKLATMILPQLEQNNHGADIVGIFSLTTISFVFAPEIQ